MHASRSGRVTLPRIASMLALSAACIGAQQANAAICPFDAATTRFETLIADEQLPGGAMLLGTRNGLLLERYVGDYDAETVVPIASASKLLSAIRIAQLAEQGTLDLDAPVSTYLPQFTGAKGTMTVAQMFSHTAGYGNDSLSPILINPNITLAEAADQIACCIDFPQQWSPGAQFAYGGVSMHVAGRVAEVIGGGDWEAQWQANVGAPLGITHIDFDTFGADNTNYGVAGAARSNLRDYGRLLRMLVTGGWADGVRLLHPSTVAEMQRDHVGALPVAYAPPNAGDTFGYGLGQWIDTAHSTPGAPFVHSLGELGFFPFIDVERGVFGIFMLRGEGGINEAALPIYLSMFEDIEAELDNGSCDPIERFRGIAGDSFESPVVVLGSD